MRKKATKVIAALLSAALIVTGVTVPGQKSAAASGISKKKATLYVSGPAAKKKLQLKIGGKKVKASWKTSKKKVATVTKKGLVKAKKAGKAVISVKYKKKTYKCTVTVKKYSYATGIKVTPATATIGVGGKQTLTVKYTGKPTTKGVTFTSSDKKIATVTAKGVVKGVSAGTAKITVTTKANVAKKALKKTVTVTVTGTEESTAPSADTSAAPDASTNPDASANPDASTDPNASASPDASTEPSRDPSKATQIVITNDVALTGTVTTVASSGAVTAHRKAYVYYDVLDQYGESMRDSVSITWTSSAGDDIKVDKATGRLTITKTTGDEFMYGSMLYIVGVDPSTGLSVNKQLTIGMEQSVDAIRFDGFVNKNAKSKKTDIKDTLPVNFAKGEWLLLYTTLDQNGNVIEAVDDNLGSVSSTTRKLSFVTNNPMLIRMDGFVDANVCTIEGDEYNATTVEPGMYVDKGGEVTISAISSKTGKKTDKVYTIGVGGLLQSLVLSQPKDVVADGDTDVKIPYVAKDTQGNTITDYETIVRSTNSLKLNSGAGTLRVKEEDDGTAGVYWSDASEYNPKSAAFYQDGQAPATSDNISRPVALTTIVVGGESNNFMLSVSDARIPSEIEWISANSLDSDAFVVGGEGEISIFHDDHKAMKYKDQYGTSLAKDKTNAFFKATSPKNGADYKGYRYGVKIKVASNNTLGLTQTVGTAKSAVKYAGATGGDAFKFLASGNEKTSNSLTFGIAKVGADKEGTYDNWDFEGKKVTKTYVTDVMEKVKNIDLAAFGTVGVESSNTVNENGNGIAEIASGPAVAVNGSDALPVVHGNDAKKVSLTGTVDGLKVEIPTQYWDVASGSAIKLNSGKNVLDTISGLKWSQLYDVNSAKNVRKNASVKVAVEVYKTEEALAARDSDALLGTPSKNVTVSDAQPYVASVKLLKGNYGGALDGATLNPIGMDIVESGDTSWGNSTRNTFTASGTDWAGCWDGGYGMIMLRVTNQYGDEVHNAADTNKVATGGLVPIFTISNIKENTGALAHVTESFTVAKNGSDNVLITGAEIGDTFTVEAYVDGYPAVKATANVKVGADMRAYVANGDDSDATFRKNTLKTYDY